MPKPSAFDPPPPEQAKHIEKKNEEHSRETKENKEIMSPMWKFKKTNNLEFKIVIV